MPRPVCVGCNIELRAERNGIEVLQVSKDGPYKVWHADLWMCPECGHQMIDGWGRNAIFTRHEDNFDYHARHCEYEFHE